MKKLKKVMSGALAFMLVTGTGACNGGGRTENIAATTAAPAATTTISNELDHQIDYEAEADIEEIDEKNEEGTGKLYVPGQKAGLVKALCYYDLNSETPALSDMLAERFGGYIETQITTSGSAYFEKLGMLVAAGDSPDLVRYDWEAFPWAISKHLYTPLDDWLDIESPLWADEANVIEQFAWGGKHYYWPEEILPNYCLIYDQNILEEVGLPNPLDLYDEGKWDWNAFDDMCEKWCAQGEDYKALAGSEWPGLMFVHTTGTKAFDINGNQFINNLKDPNIQRTMEWLQEYGRRGYTQGEWVDPNKVFLDRKVLFMAMYYEWGFTSAQQGAFQNNLDQDFAFAPIPKDPQADKYYHSGYSVGYLVPSGAKNVQGGVQYILCSRIHATDPDVIAEFRAEKLDTSPGYYAKCPECKYNFVENNQDKLDTCPECNAARKRKYKELYTERLFNLIDDFKDPEKFELVYDAAFGMGDDMKAYFTRAAGNEDTLFDGPVYSGSSYTVARDEYYNLIETMIQPFRDSLAEEQ